MNFLNVAIHVFLGAVVSAISYPWRSGLSLPKFRERFYNEGLFILDREAREIFQKVSGCVSCGSCETDISSIGMFSVHFPVNMADLIMHSRSVCDVQMLKDKMEKIRQMDLIKLQEKCPLKIPFAKLVSLLESFVSLSNNSSLDE